MDTHHRLPTITPPGRVNQCVYVCHKCGWPFPKLHPSAKHRRSHKRICGTIEGYKLISGSEHNLTISDDEQDHPSDEDCDTPSPKIEKGGIVDSSGIGERSNRSEDEVFSDAVAEFSDSVISSGSEEQVEDVKEFEKYAQTTVVGDMGSSMQTSKVDAISDSAQPLSSLPANDIASLNGLVESIKFENVEAEMSAQGHSPLSAPVENTEAIVNTVHIESCLFQDMDAGTHSKLLEIHDTNREAKEATHVQSVAHDLHIVEHADIMPKDFEDQKTLNPDFPLMLGSADVEKTVDEDNKDVQKGQSNMSAETLAEFECERAVHDLSHLSGPAEQMEASVSTVSIEVDPSEDKDSSTHGHGDSVEICDTNKESKKTMHVLSVASDLPVVNRADIMLEDFKDHRTFKRGFPPLGSDNLVRSLEGDNERMVMEEDPSGLHSSKPGGAGNSSADMDDVEEDMITIEGPDKGVADSLKSSVTIGEAPESEGLESPPSTFRSEKENIQTNRSLQGEPHYIASPRVSSDNDEVSQTTRLSDDNNNNHNEMARAEVVIEGNENSEGVTRKEHSAEAHTNFVYEDGHQTTKLTRKNNEGEHVEVIAELSDEAWIEKSTEAAAVEKFATTAMIKLEPESELLDSNYSASIPDTPVLITDTTVSANMMVANPSSRNFSGNDCQEVTTETDINSGSKGVGGGILDSKFSRSGDVEIAEGNLKKPVMIEPETLPRHSEISDGSSPDLKTGHGRDGFVSEPTQESEGKLTKQPGGASAIDISADSSSQTGSVEGNWGSVSVLSAQSDQAAFAGTEVQLNTDPEGPDKSESTNLHQKVPSQKLVSGTPDVFEPPSFMTLVEPRYESDKKSVTFEIETEQVTKQPKFEALQAGWLPSLSNIVNESPGRKKNEEIIAKVTNWSTDKQQSTPLKNLLGEAKVETKTKSPSPKQTESNIQKDETEAKSNASSATTVKEVLGSEAPADDQAVKRETAEEWNSPARYPAKIKKEKKKAKGKPSWVPFVCCSSVN